MIMGYLFMTYVAVVSCWPVSLILLLTLAAILLHSERKILRVISKRRLSTVWQILIFLRG